MGPSPLHKQVEAGSQTTSDFQECPLVSEKHQDSTSLIPNILLHSRMVTTFVPGFGRASASLVALERCFRRGIPPLGFSLPPPALGDAAAL